jgi:hypothetical protein
MLQVTALDAFENIAERVKVARILESIIDLTSFKNGSPYARQRYIFLLTKSLS